MTNDELIQAAIGYSEKGWCTFPVRGKVPTCPQGFKNATKIPAEITELFTKYPGNGIGLATGKVSGVFVLDVDVKNGACGDETLFQLEQKHGKLPETLQSITPSKGLHYFFKYPENGIGSNAGIVGKGLDIRGDGGYVVLSPSPGYLWEVAHVPE